MPIQVKKFGGSSVGDPGKIRHVAQRVADDVRRGNSVVVVVSAMGDTTDDLIALAEQVAETRSAREMDQLLSTGEQVSAALLAMALESLGVAAVSLTGAQAGIRTQTAHARARILGIDAARIQAELEAGKVVVVTGFQGVDEAGEVYTLGRGGSDTSAVALAAALGAPECEIFTDVAGVYSCDPRLVSDAVLLPRISYEEMLELAMLGAQVLHPRSVECAKEYGIVIHVRSTFLPDAGTLVKGVDQLMENHRAVSGVSLDTNQAKVALLEVPDRPGIASRIFQELAEAGVSVDMIIQSVRGDVTNDVAFTVSRNDLAQAVSIAERVAAEIGAAGVVYDANVAKVSIVGVGMIGRPGIAAKMFDALAQAGINIMMISTSEIKVSCIIAADRAKEAARLIHDHFQLSADQLVTTEA